MTVNILAILQARMTSSRLPGKVMSDIGGRPMLQHMLERVQRSKAIHGVVIATTTDPSDDILEQYCRRQSYPCYRGSLHDVLERYYQTAAQYHADVIVRLTADCPLIDPDLIDLTVSIYLGNSNLLEYSPGTLKPDPSLRTTDPFDFVADRLPPPWKRTLPIGLDVEVCSFNALESAWKQADQRYQREHVMPYLYEGVLFPQPKPTSFPGWYIQLGTSPRGFRVALLNHAPDYGALRWTVDTPADLEFVRQIFARFKTNEFSWQDILALLEKEPELATINMDVEHKTAFDVDQRASTP